MTQIPVRTLTPELDWLEEGLVGNHQPKVVLTEKEKPFILKTEASTCHGDMYDRRASG